MALWLRHLVQGAPKKVWITTCNGRSNSHFFFGHFLLFVSKGSFQKVSIFGLLRGKNKNVLELPKNHFKDCPDQKCEISHLFFEWEGS